MCYIAAAVTATAPDITSEWCRGRVIWMGSDRAGNSTSPHFTKVIAEHIRRNLLTAIIVQSTYHGLNGLEPGAASRIARNRFRTSDGEFAVVQHVLGIELGGEHQFAHVGGEDDVLIVLGERQRLAWRIRRGRQCRWWCLPARPRPRAAGLPLACSVVTWRTRSSAFLESDLASGTPVTPSTYWPSKPSGSLDLERGAHRRGALPHDRAFVSGHRLGGGLAIAAGARHAAHAAVVARGARARLGPGWPSGPAWCSSGS